MFIYLKSINFLLISLIVILLNGCSSTNMKDLRIKLQSLIFLNFSKVKHWLMEFLKIDLENLEDSSELKLKEVLKKTSLHLMKNLFTTTAKKQQGFGKLKN